jgi:ATPase subunit of ABC transporter with duplicated ATPase domains
LARRRRLDSGLLRLSLAVGWVVCYWRGGVVVASHDRDLLEVMDRIVELTPIGVWIVGGGWSAFAQVREAEKAQAASESERADARLSEARRAI